MRRRSIIILATALAAAVVIVWPRVRSRDIERGKLQGANLVLITLDTTRADRIGAYGYAQAATPNLDRLATEGILFEQCITPTAYTLPSHASIMTGLYPPRHGVRLNGQAALPDSQTTLAERLAANGYRTGAFAGAFVLDSRWGISQGFQHYDDEFPVAQNQQLDLARVQRPADKVVDAALDWLQRDDSRPFFAWLHFYDPHTPYAPPEPFRSRFADGGLSGLYDGEIAFADSQVGRVLQWLDESGRSDDTIVIVTSDHGEGLGSHGEREHGYFIYDYAVRVPLIIRLPGASPTRVRSQVRTVDILPTVLDVIGTPLADAVDGESLTPLLREVQNPRGRPAYSESVATRLQYGWAGLYSLRTNDYKFIEAPRSELYELASDPSETTNRIDDLRRVAVRLKNELGAIRAAAEAGAPKTQEADLDSETRAKLVSLGYLTGTMRMTTSDERDLPDPKDKMHLFTAVAHAANLMVEQDHLKAASVLEGVLMEDPGIAQAQLLISSAYRKTGRTEKAKAVLDNYLKENPDDTPALISMAEILLEEGRGNDVLAICRKALATDDQNARAYELMADVHIVRRDHQAAIPLLQKVVAVQPKLTRSRNNLAASLIGAGRYEEAEKLLREVIQQYPKFPLAHYHLGLLREAQRRYAEARAEYATEVENHPKSTVARFNYGNLLLRLGDTHGAETQMRTLIAQDPSSARPYLILGQALLDRPGHLAEVEKLALAGLERAEEAEIKALGYFLLADVYSREGRSSELQDALRKGQHYRALIRS